MVLQLGGWVRGKQLLTAKKQACYKMLHRASEVAHPYKHGTEPSGSIKGREFLD
jgi:hypothetical protein